MIAHYIVQGDSLGLTTTKTACGEMWKPGTPMDDGKERMGYFGEDATLKKVTCRKCIGSRLFRSDWKHYFQDEPHPFQAAAKKAVITRKIRKDVRAAKTELMIEFFNTLPKKEREAVKAILNKE